LIGDVPSGSTACTSNPGTQGLCVAAPSLPAPVTVCCERGLNGNCAEETTSENSDLSNFYSSCAYAAGEEPLQRFVVGTCGTDGHCVPAH